MTLFYLLNGKKCYYDDAYEDPDFFPLGDEFNFEIKKTYTKRQNVTWIARQSKLEDKL
jgi:hypothetical protein